MKNAKTAERIIGQYQQRHNYMYVRDPFLGLKAKALSHLPRRTGLPHQWAEYANIIVLAVLNWGKKVYQPSLSPG